MNPTDDTCDCQQLAIVGNGRLGSAIARTLGRPTPYGRGFEGLADDGRPYEFVLLCVPDTEIGAAAAAIVPGPIIGHCSGASGLEPLGPREGFSLHPLMTVTTAGADFTGAGAAIDATSERALGYANALAGRLGMKAFRVLPEDRAAYHAAASFASNFLVTIESAAEQLGRTTGIDRQLLVPLVKASVENWAALGGERALTGPVARGDLQTVDRQRAAVEERTPQLLGLFDALVDATAALARTPTGASA